MTQKTEDEKRKVLNWGVKQKTGRWRSIIFCVDCLTVGQFGSVFVLVCVDPRLVVRQKRPVALPLFSAQTDTCHPIYQLFMNYHFHWFSHALYVINSSAVFQFLLPQSCLNSGAGIRFSAKWLCLPGFPGTQPQNCRPHMFCVFERWSKTFQKNIRGSLVSICLFWYLSHRISPIWGPQWQFRKHTWGFPLRTAPQERPDPHDKFAIWSWPWSRWWTPLDHSHVCRHVQSHSFSKQTISFWLTEKGLGRGLFH